MKTNSYWIRIFQVCFTACYVGKLCATDGTTLVLTSLGNTGVRIVQLFIPGLTNLKPICEMCIALKLPSTLVGLVLNWPKMGMMVLPLRVQQNETLLRRAAGRSQKRILSIILEELFVSRRRMEVPYSMTSPKSVFVNVSYICMYINILKFFD
jgi:hypothetical protein